MVLASALPGPLLLGAAVGLLLGSIWPGLLIAAAGSALLARRPRRRSLTSTSEGVLVQRDGYRLVAGWQDIAGVRVGRHQGLFPVEELVLARSELRPMDSRGRPSRVPQGAQQAGADRRIQVSFYDKNWRTGAIGDQLRRRGILA
jgi:hypothetical protein